MTYDAADTYVVIPVFNRRGTTRACLEALAEQTASGFTVVVVDDGSTDGTSDMIAAEFPDVALLRGDGSLWWSGATNEGVRYALEHGAEFVIALNDDTRPAPDLIEQLVSAGRANPGALIGAAGRDPGTGRYVWGGTRVRWLTASAEDLLHTLPVERQRGLHAVTHLPGRGLLVPASVFGEVGLFAAREFPQAAADFDFTLRAARAGHPLYIDFDAVLETDPTRDGGAAFAEERSWANYRRHLFHRRGSGNLPMFWRFAWRNCPPLYLVPYLMIGTARRLGGYLRDWAREAAAGSGEA